MSVDITKDTISQLPKTECAKPTRTKPCILDFYIDEIKDAVQRGVPTPRITRDINSKLPEMAKYSEAGVYRFIIRRGLRN